jgi:hypothetical protein
VMTLKLEQDVNLQYVQDTYSRLPLREVATVSIAASGSGTATINVPAGDMWFIKSWTVTKGADISVSSIAVDGNDTYEIASLTDTVARYGALLTADSKVTISGSNAGLSAESLEIQVDGYKLEI